MIVRHADTTVGRNHAQQTHLNSINTNIKVRSGAREFVAWNEQIGENGNGCLITSETKIHFRDRLTYEPSLPWSALVG